MACNDLNDLSVLLRKDGDKILDGTCKLSLSTTLLRKVNDSISNIFGTTSQQVNRNNVVENFFDLDFIYNFIQKTLALKILPDRNTRCNQLIDINIFQSLRLLEVQRFSLNFIKGIKCIRAQLEYLTCIRSLGAIKDVLEFCGADRTQGFVWKELKEAVFSYNGINNLDESLQFAPGLETLDLSFNNIKDVQSLNCLLNLKHLNLGYNQIQRVPALSGQICDKLEILVLCNNFIEDIRDLFMLTNLRELDLSNNCLMEHTALIPLTNMSFLTDLKLAGNPMTFHPQHRIRTVRFLHINTTFCDFKLDEVPLSRYEMREVGYFQSFSHPFERSSSFNSVTTESTVIRKPIAIGNDNQTSDIGGSLGSTSQQEIDIEVTPRQLSETRVLLQEVVSVIHDNQTMQDSGIVARPLSPSECSIEIDENSHNFIPELNTLVTCSAASLATSDIDHEYGHNVKYCESDIEVLSNPSQSSIEVLGRFIHPSTFVPKSKPSSTNNDLLPTEETNS